MLFRLSLKPVGAHHRRAALRVGSCSRKVTVDGAELRQLIQKSAEFVALPVREQRAQIKKRKDDARRRLEERDPRLAKKREREQLKAKQKADALKKKQELAAAKQSAQDAYRKALLRELQRTRRAHEHFRWRPPFVDAATKHREVKSAERRFRCFAA